MSIKEEICNSLSTYIFKELLSSFPSLALPPFAKIWRQAPPQTAFM